MSDFWNKSAVVDIISLFGIVLMAAIVCLVLPSQESVSEINDVTELPDSPIIRKKLAFDDQGEVYWINKDTIYISQKTIREIARLRIEYAERGEEIRRYDSLVWGTPVNSKHIPAKAVHEWGHRQEKK